MLSKGWRKFLAKTNSDLSNLSIISENFPGLSKGAKLSPLYKKGSPAQPFNYKPIFLLPLLSKVIKKGIHDQLFF